MTTKYKSLLNTFAIISITILTLVFLDFALGEFIEGWIHPK